jgi:hypothetical protein
MKNPFSLCIGFLLFKNVSVREGLGPPNLESDDPEGESD